MDSGPDPVEEISHLEMMPSDGANGAYAVFTPQGKLHLNFSTAKQQQAGTGINNDTVTYIHNVFKIANVDNSSVPVWVELEANDVAVEFYRSSDPTASIQGESNAVQVNGNDNQQVGVLIDTTGKQIPESFTFTVYSKAEDDESEDETPTEQDPVTAPSEETPVEETPTDNTPDEGGDETSDDETPSSETPTQSTPSETDQGEGGSGTTTITPTPTQTAEPGAGGAQPDGGDDQDTDGTEQEGEVIDPTDDGLGAILGGPLSNTLWLLLVAAVLGVVGFAGLRRWARN
ncbi:DUF1102 domain-containing protein [Halovenus rubra]|uniref:DUF1102 domain-containing protein n=3 Tax=Halovenus rubra TaxID=869890 RepID=A0ACC7DWQ6_9EURY